MGRPTCLCEGLDAGGRINYDVWAQAIKEAGGVRVSRAELQKVLQKYDRGGTGLVYEEFEELLKTLLNIPHGKVVVRRGNLAQPERYSTQTIWLSTLLNFAQSEVLVGIGQPLFWASFISLLTATAQVRTAGMPGGQASKSLVQMHSLLGGALSLLLVFSTNSAYNRFWEARRIWESIVNRCRDLSRFVRAAGA
mmetsp:Transcript_36084/g.81892  ORF Transcript_36084/g.81892 Transcript_36084/m.81892 type:complete len:194 (-) Transcript_36084:76-657(-)